MLLHEVKTLKEAKEAQRHRKRSTTSSRDRCRRRYRQRCGAAAPWRRPEALHQGLPGEEADYGGSG